MKRWTLRIMTCLILGVVTTVAVAWGCAVFTVNTNYWTRGPGFMTDVAVPPVEVDPSGCWIIVKDDRAPGIRIALLEWIAFDHAFESFVHYVLMAKPAMARTYAQFILTNAADAELRTLTDVDSVRVQDAFDRADRWDELADVASRLHERIISSQNQRASDGTDGVPESPMSTHELLAVEAGWPLLACEGAVLRSRTPGWFVERTTVTDALDFTAWGGDAAGRLVPYGPRPGALIANTLFFASVWMSLLFGPRSARHLWWRWRGRCPKCGYDLRGHVRHAERGATEEVRCPECGWGGSSD